MEALSNRQRRSKLDAIRDACRDYIAGPLHETLTALVADATGGAGLVEVDEADPDGQTLLIHYPEAEPLDGAYVRPLVRIESGAKSALEPNEPVQIRPYIADDATTFDLAVPGVTTIEPGRVLGQGGDRARTAALVRTPGFVAPGRPACVTALLRSPLRCGFGRRQSCSY